MGDEGPLGSSSRERSGEVGTGSAEGDREEFGARTGHDELVAQDKEQPKS